MASTAANLVEHVLPPSPLRQWVLTVPYPRRKRLAYDGELLGALTRIFVSTVLRFYAERMKKEGVTNGQSGAVVVVQRTSSDLKCNPHLHVLFLDGVYRELGEEPVFRELPRLSTREVGDVLGRAVQRMTRHVRRRGLRDEMHDDEEPKDAGGLAALAASAASGRTPPAGPEWRRKRGPLPPLVAQELAFDKPLCASLDGFTLYAATRAGALDAFGRETLCKYVLRPAVAQERVTQGPNGLVRITLKKPFSDGTVAVDMDPLSLLCRLAASVPPPRLHTVRYAGVLAPASKLRPRIVPKPPATPANDLEPSAQPKRGGSRYRPWAELLKRCFSHRCRALPELRPALPERVNANETAGSRIL
jgi:putative transposase